MDYQDRLVEEYSQTSERYAKLGNTIDQYLDGTLPFQLDCLVEILMTQYFAMQTYLSVLEMRLKLHASMAAQQPQEGPEDGEAE